MKLVFTTKQRDYKNELAMTLGCKKVVMKNHKEIWDSKTESLSSKITVVHLPEEPVNEP